jgi:bifunctional DNA-binding transcriptional regulator/antitoxin component of YhaV-PrlF toxin-antitoxin module
MKLKDKNTRKITRVGKTSLAVTLPKEMAEELGWREKQRLSVKRVKGGIILRDFRKK